MTGTDVQRIALLAMALLVGCLGDDTGSISSPSAVRHAFVVLGEDGQPTARAITVAAACPARWWRACWRRRRSAS